MYQGGLKGGYLRRGGGVDTFFILPGVKRNTPAYLEFELFRVTLAYVTHSFSLSNICRPKLDPITSLTISILKLFLELGGGYIYYQLTIQIFLPIQFTILAIVETLNKFLC